MIPLHAVSVRVYELHAFDHRKETLKKRDMRPKPIRLFSRAAVLLLMMLLTGTTAWAWSGSGNSQNDPYLIASASDLIQLATNVNNGTDYSGKYFKQTAPITLSGNWTPIGTSGKPFKGKYDGDNKTISGLTVSGSYQYAGLFGYTIGTGDYNACTLKNIIVTDCNIDVSDTDNSYAGGISGYATDNTHIINCRVSGIIKAKTNAGGIAGYLWTIPSGTVAWISQCFTDVTVAAIYKGKLFGRGAYTETYDPSVFNNKTSHYHADGSGVTAFGQGADNTYSVPLYTVSGIPSGVTMATINATLTYNDTSYFAANATTTLTIDDANKVFNTFSVSGATYSLAADKRSVTITLGSSDAIVSATFTEVHTVTPANGLQVTSAAYFTYSNTSYYKTGTIVTVAPTSQYHIVDGTGGTGSASATIAADKRSFSFTMPAQDVSPTATLTEVHTVTPANGVTIQTAMADNLGFSYGGKNYWRTGVELTLSGLPTDDPGQGYQYAYTTNGIDISGTTLTVGNEDITVSYVLQPIDWATETIGDNWDHAYIIYNKDQLDLLAQRVNNGTGDDDAANGYSGKYFVLGANIEYSHTTDWNDENSIENNYTAIGGIGHYFKGHFDGQGHTISGIRIYNSSDGYQGLFGRTEGATIQGITLADVRITGLSFIGDIVGRNDGTVSNCNVAADVYIDAGSFVGGIVGANFGTVSNCTSAATLTAISGQYLGGIVGWNTGTVNDCTSAATLTAISGQYCGGIVGENNSGSTLRHNFAIGASVHAASGNSHGAICGRNNNFSTTGILENNYYNACKVARNDITATSVGCGYIDDGHGGYITADVTDNNGAVPAFLVTLNDGVTIQTAMAADLGFSYGGKNYWLTGTVLTLVLPDLPTDVPPGYLKYAYTANGKVIGGTIVIVGNEDITIKRTLIVDPAVGKLLTLTANGNGTVAIDECTGMSDNGDGTYAVLPGTTISVKITPAAGSYFKNWNTEAAINSNVAVTSTFTVTDDMTLTANFVDKPMLTLTADGNGTVDIQAFIYGNKTIIPSSSIDQIVVCTSYQDEGGDNLFDNIVSGNNKWCTVADDKYVEFRTSKAVKVNGYTLFTANDNSSIHGRNPKSWVLKAKLNGSDNWTTIASVDNDNTMMDIDYTPFDFLMDIPGTYRYFRLEVSGVHDSMNNILQLGELQLFYQKLIPIDGVTKSATANTYIVDYGKVMTVKATPVEGKCVKNWDNDNPIIPATAATVTKIYTLTENTTVTAYFASYHTLTPSCDITVNGMSVSQGSTITVPTGSMVVLSHNHVGYTASYTVNTTSIDGSTFIMPDEDVTVTMTFTKNVLALSNDADNASAIATAAGDGKVYEVTLSGRTLTKDGNWNTLCLPFSMTAEQIAASPLAGATIKTLDNTASGTSLDNDGKLTLKFNTVTAIEAGKPYIIKWASGDNIVTPVFSEVTISSTTPTPVVSNDGRVTFVGQYSPFSIVNSGATGDNEGNKNEIILMATGNKIGYSQNERTLKCFRCHFYIPVVYAARSIVADFGETTKLSEELRVKSEEFATAVEWYTLDGRKLDGKLTTKGMYIVNGKKIVIK